MFERFKKFKEAITQSSSQDTKTKSVKPKADTEKKERFGSMTQEQMRRIEASGVSLLTQPKLSDDALKSLEGANTPISNLNSKPAEPTSKSSSESDTISVESEHPNKNNKISEEQNDSHVQSMFESDEFNDVSQATMDSLQLSLPVVPEKLSNFIDEEDNNDLNKSTLEEKNSDSSSNNSGNVKQTLFVHSKSPVDKFPLDPESNMFAQTIATNYSQGDTAGCILQLRNFLNQHKGEVNNKFWYMLMDIYQVEDDKQNFEKTALAFAQLFDTSPPSWTENTKSEKKGILAGKNILILEPAFNMEHVSRFKDFFKAAKQEKFCKINVSQCRFEQSDVEALKEFYKLLVQLRKTRIKSFLMGESALLSFSQSYMNFDQNQKGLKQHFMDNEALFWNLYLEILQWKGKEEEFEQIALDFADKFEISPNGWEDEGVMSLENLSVEDEKPQLDSVLNNSNISVIQEIIKYDFSKMNKSELDFSNVSRVDFSTCGGISFMINDILSRSDNLHKDIYLIRPNEMILTLFDMLGTSDSFKIVNRKR